MTKEKFDINLPAGYSMLTDFINRFEKNIYIQPFIDKVKQKCRMGLLTNMYPRMLLAMTEKGIMPEANWDVVIDSTVERLRKPDLKIFELAERRANTKKDEIFFVDNTVANINVAKDFGSSIIPLIIKNLVRIFWIIIIPIYSAIQKMPREII